MARHGKKPSEESTSSHTPRTLAGSATTNTSADSTDAAASGIAVNSSTVSSAFASDADGNTGNTLVGNASNEVEATEVKTNATSTNATGERTISSNTAEISNRQSHESSESHQPQDLFDAAIAQGISDGDAWTDQRVKHIYRQIIIAVVVVVVVLGAVFGFTGVRASQQMRDLAALNDCKEAVTAMNTSYSKAFQLKAKDLRSVHQLRRILRSRQACRTAPDGSYRAENAELRRRHFRYHQQSQRRKSRVRQAGQAVQAGFAEERRIRGHRWR